MMECLGTDLLFDSIISLKTVNLFSYSSLAMRQGGFHYI